MRYHAVIFDLDGTLLDTLEDLAQTVNEILIRWGYAPHPLTAYRRFVGNGVEMLLRRATPEGVLAAMDERTRRRLLDDFRAAYAERKDRSTRPYPGINKLLRQLWEAGVPAAVLSNKPHEAVVRVVAQKLGEHPFALVQGALPDVPLKPDPTSALELASRLGVQPEDVLYLGDSDVDMRTAKAAGFFAVGAAWGFRGPEELLAAGADAICAIPAEVMSLMQH